MGSTLDTPTSQALGNWPPKKGEEDIPRLIQSRLPRCIFEARSHVNKPLFPVTHFLFSFLLVDSLDIFSLLVIHYFQNLHDLDPFVPC